MAAVSPQQIARASAALVLALVAGAGMLDAQAVQRKPAGAGPGTKSPTLKSGGAAAAVSSPAAPGQAVYRKQCAACHGGAGEGSRAYQKPLIGDKSVNELSRYIGANMPPGKKKCPPADAAKVAAYIHEAFYSPVAQARNRPPRVELSRLTVRQYRNAVADLIGSFRGGPTLTAERGLRADYYKTRRFRGNERVTQKVDPQIDFDWGKNVPFGDRFDPHQFSIRWDGSVIAPETGEYEFIVQTGHAARLWVNDLRTPLVDAWVKSGNDTEYRSNLFLVGGRAYPIRLEFSKANQGVDDTPKLKDRPVGPARLSLKWRCPKAEPEAIPQRALSTVTLPEAYIAATAFPPDDRSLGYERGSSVSKAWSDATTEAAIDAAGYVARRLTQFIGADEASAERATKARAFCVQFATRAFGRPLTPELESLFVERQLAGAPDLETGVKRTILLVLKSPRFLFREARTAQPDAYDTAARLSFGLWDSIPDAELLRAAGAGELSSREQVLKQADRMLGDLRARSKVRDFFLQWLKVDHHPDLAKDAKAYPGFDSAVANDLRTSLELTLDDVVWSEKSDFRELLLTSKVYLNGRLAKLYGVNLPENAPFQAVSLEESERAGILSHPYILSSFAYLDATSPIHRGVLIARNLLGRVLQPPPIAVSPIAPSLHPGLTTRERVNLQTKPAACSRCHDMINPLGYALERFDAIGRLREQDNGKPVDTRGSYETRSGKVVRFQGARELATFLTQSEEAQAAFVEKFFQYLVKQPIRAYGPEALPQLQKALASDGFSIRRQILESIAVNALSRQG